MTEKEAMKVLENHIRFLKEAWKPYPDFKVIDAIETALISLKKDVCNVTQAEQLKEQK